MICSVCKSEIEELGVHITNYALPQFEQQYYICMACAKEAAVKLMCGEFKFSMFPSLIKGVFKK